MNSEEIPTQSGEILAVSGKGRFFVKLLAGLVGTEALLVTSGSVYFFTQMFVQEVNNMAGAIVIFAITTAIALGLFAVSIACFKNKGWTRGAIVTWQILQFAAATSFIQGIIEWQPVGWLLTALSAATVVIVFVPSVTKTMTSDG